MPNNNNEGFGNSTGVWVGKNMEKKVVESAVTGGLRPNGTRYGVPELEIPLPEPPKNEKTTNKPVKGHNNWEEVTFNNHPKV
jgi:hypothetical protein